MRRLWRTLGSPLWRWPVVLGVASGIGLLGALVGDGAWDVLSWVALTSPAAVAAWHGVRRQSPG